MINTLMGKYSGPGRSGALRTGFPSGATWGTGSTGVTLSNGNLLANMPPGTSDRVVSGTSASAIPANRKIYMEYEGQRNGHNIGSGFHNNLTATLGSIWYRFYITNIDADLPRAPGANATYLGSNSNTTQYFGGSQDNAPVDFDRDADSGKGINLTGWAIDTINNKVWVRCTGTNSGSYDDWMGGGNPEDSTSTPTFSADFTGLYFFGASFYVSFPSGEVAVPIRLRLGTNNDDVNYNFTYTPPVGFDYNE